MNVTYDETVDAMYIYLHGGSKDAVGTVVKTERLESDVVIDYDKDGKVLGVEILNASRKFPCEFWGSEV